MVFSSHLFLFYFLPTSLVLYYLSPRWFKHLTLTAVSYVFYGWVNPLLVGLMFVSTLIDYLCGLALVGHFKPSTWREPIPLLPVGQPRTTRQRWVLAVSMILNLSLLGFFKYFNFFITNYTALFTLFGVPAVQTYCEVRQYTEGRRDNSWPQFCDIFDALPQATAAYRKYDGGWISKTFQANAALLQSIEEYERDLKAESFLTQSVLPLTQELLIHVGNGNEKGYVGRERWLFYRPGIDYCTGPGFLDPRYMARRADSGTQLRPAPQPDPRMAILQFHRQLAERDIQLVLMPTPDKATVHPEMFSSYYDNRRMSVQNPSYRKLLDELEAEGVLVCDVTDTLAWYRDRSGRAVYLATDTHWRPEAMALAATELVRFIEAKGTLSATAARRYRRETSKNVKSLGDIAMMLKLRQNQSVFGEESVTIRPVIDAAGEPWRPDPAAEVLVLGDSFANIYSVEMMNWGRGAGFQGAFGWDRDTMDFKMNEKYSWRSTGFAQSDSHPVVNVSWNDATEFCKWLSRKEGKTYRLPTEAEWEYACRAGTTTSYSHGDDSEGSAKVGNVADAAFETQFPELKGVIKASDGHVYTSPAGSFVSNAFGLFDMHGNVWEWCSDWYTPEYYATSPTNDPGGPTAGEERVYRGGGWFNCTRGCRSASRSASQPENRNLTLGFRIAMTAE